MTPPGIYILSQPIHSGKTTMLQNWLKGQANAVGILTPDINGIRKVYDIADKTYYDLQADETYTGELISIGKYRFSTAGFEKARDILLRSANSRPQWLIVDEVGKLEIEQHTGLEPALSQIIDLYKVKPAGKILMVIRDYLLTQAIAHYKLEGAMALDKSFFE